MSNPDPMSRENPTKQKSMAAAAVKKRRYRERKKQKQAVEAVNTSESAVLHETTPIRTVDSPERFAAEPEPISTVETPLADDPPTGEPGSPPVETTADGGPTPQQADTPPKPETTAGEAQLFGKLVVGYFQIGTAALFAKDPRTALAFGALVQSAPKMEGRGPLTPEEAFGAVCGFIQACSERVALKYNLRIPYMDELVVAGAIGVATFGLIPKKKTPEQKAAAAKDANVKPGQPANENVPPIDPNAQPVPNYTGDDPVELDDRDV